MLKVGDWVKVNKKFGVFKKEMTIVGFVDQIRNGEIWIYRVYEVCDGETRHHEQPVIASFHHSRVKKAEIELDRADIESLVDLALRTKDEVWFREIMMMAGDRVG